MLSYESEPARETALDFRCAPRILWAVETRGIFLIDPPAEGSCFLPYPQAAIWDLMSRGCSYPRMISVLAVVASLERREAERLLHETLREWVAAGFVETRRSHG